MRRVIPAMLLALVSTAAVAVEIPDEATKKAALMLAYELNGNSMVRYGPSIDLSAPPLPKADRVIPLDDPKKKKDRR